MNENENLKKEIYKKINDEINKNNILMIFIKI